MQLSFWGNTMELGGPYLAADLRSSNDVLDEPATLRRRLEEDGYLLIRELRNPSVINNARREVLEALGAQGSLEPGTPILDAVVNRSQQKDATTGVRGNEELRLLPAVQALFHMPEVTGFFERTLGGKVGSFDFQWLRVAGPGAESPIHSDIVFMGRGTPNVYTCWTPLGDVPLELGPIVMCLGSHRIPALKDTYWKADVDRDLIEGYFTKDPIEMVDKFGCRWSTTSFRAGDVLIFGMHILHGSLANSSDRYRISADARYQLASEPFDARWVGSAPKGHYKYWQPGVQLEPLAVTRSRWGL